MAGRNIFDSAGDETEKYLIGDDGTEREIYVDGVHGFMINGLTVKMNLYSRGFHSDGTKILEGERREVVCRLVMALDTLLSLSKYLNEQVERVKETTGFSFVAVVDPPESSEQPG